MTRPNATPRQNVTLILARPFYKLSWIGFVTKVRHLFFSGFTVLLVPVRRRSFRQLKNFCGFHQNFGGSFFFSRGKKGRDQGRLLFSTIAYQLALKVPGLRQHVNRIMELNPTLHTKSMDVQLQTLIVHAFQYLSPLPQRSYLVIIDGLDECHDKATKQLILQLLCNMITVHKLPLRFLIGSRPESHIRDSFDQESLHTITRRVVLHETFDPGRDIQVSAWWICEYLCQESYFDSRRTTMARRRYY